MFSIAKRLSKPQRRFDHAVCSRLAVRLSLGALILCFSGCEAEIPESPRETTLEQQLSEQFHEKEIKIVIRNSNELDITFIDSPLNDRGEEERVKLAQQTVLFMKQHYPRIDQIEGFWVSFAVHKTRFLVVPYTDGINAFAFDKNGKLVAGYTSKN